MAGSPPSLSRTRFALLVSLILAAVAGVGCGPPWIVMRQAMPNPLLGQALVVDPVRYDGLMVGDEPEPAYQARKDPGQQQSWQVDKQETAAIIVGGILGATQGLRVGPAPGPAGAFIARPRIVFVEPGFYIGIAARSTEVEMLLEIVDARGALVDQIRTRVAVPASLANPSSGGRMREAGQSLAMIAARYLRERLSGVVHNY